MECGRLSLGEATPPVGYCVSKRKGSYRHEEEDRKRARKKEMLE